MATIIYLLQFNSEVLFPSKNIKTLHDVMCRRCAAEGRDLPEAYATVRRRIIADGVYKHVPLPGWEYKIIRRDLLHKPIQRKLPLEIEADVKQSVG
jgi:hypothetical protein